MNTYYQVRVLGDGEFAYFLVDPNDEQNGFDPSSRTSAIKAARELNGKVVMVTEQEIKITPKELSKKKSKKRKIKDAGLKQSFLSSRTYHYENKKSSMSYVRYYFRK